MHFFVDNATSVPQYLVCKHPTVQFVGLQKSEIGLQKQLNLLKEGVQLMATKKKAAKKKKKK